MIKEKVFYLGFGGQKCGSSWYQSYLARQPASDFGKLTEYQIWESELGFPFSRYRVKPPTFKEKLIFGAKWNLNRSVPNRYLKWRMQHNKEEYFNYFSKILSKPDVIRSGDVTPSYAALTDDTIRKIKHGFDIQKITTRAIFSMRDPVARLRSHLHMNQQKGYLKTSGDYIQDLKDFYATREAEARMRYEKTIHALEAVFSPENLYLCLFEEMLTPEGVASFSKFAEIDYDPAACNQKINTRNSEKISLTEEIEEEISEYYRDVYKEVYKRLPQILSLWPSAKYILNK
jgi:hypothetical protein